MTEPLRHCLLGVRLIPRSAHADMNLVAAVLLAFLPPAFSSSTAALMEKAREE